MRSMVRASRVGAESSTLAFCVMPKKKLPVIAEPAPGTRAVLCATADFKGPLLQGLGPLKLVCGKCGYVLVRGVNGVEHTNVVLQCPSCRSYNDAAKLLVN